MNRLSDFIFDFFLNHLIFSELWPLAYFGILNSSERYLKNSLS